MRKPIDLFRALDLARPQRIPSLARLGGQGHTVRMRLWRAVFFWDHPVFRIRDFYPVGGAAVILPDDRRGGRFSPGIIEARGPR